MGTTDLDHALSACRGTFLALLGFGFALNLLLLVSPLYMMQVFDRVLGAHSLESLLALTAAALVAHLVLAIVDALRGQVLSRVAGYLEERVGPAVLRAALTGNGRTAKACAADTGTAGLRDLATLRAFLSGPAAATVLDLVWAPIFLAALALLHPELGLMGLAGGLVLGAIGVAAEALTRRRAARAAVAVRQGQMRAERALRQADVLRALGMIDNVIHRWRWETREAVAAQETTGDWNGALAGASKFVRLTIQTLVTAAAARLVLTGAVESGAMVAASMLLGRALAPLENSIGAWRASQGARHALARLRQSLPPLRMPAVTKLPPPTGRVAVERLSYVPPGGRRPTLLGIDFRLVPGECLAIVGPSGAGKSTLARLLAGALEPTAGRVLLDDAELALWQASGAGPVGYLPEDVELLDATVARNIARLGKAEDADIVAAAALAGLDEVLRRLPNGYDTEVGEEGHALSAGVAQRVGLARAIFGRPAFIVLDAPASSLDEAGKAALVEAVRALKRAGRTLVVTAPPAELANEIDWTLRLEDGQALDLVAKPRGEGTVRDFAAIGAYASF